MHIIFIEDLFSEDQLRGEPLNILQLSAILKQAGHVVSLFDLREAARIRDAIKKSDRVILAYSLRTGFHVSKISFNARIKKEFPFVFSVVGGHHATFSPECINEEGIDAVCLGEADEALLELCDKYETRQDVFNTQNFWLKKNEQIIKNKLRPPVENLDILPLFDRELLYQYGIKKDQPIKTHITSRGCPFSCTYCYAPAWKALYPGNFNFFRQQSPQRVIQEIEHIKKQAVLKFLIFEDDIFTYSKKWLRVFGELYKKHVKIPYWVYTHVKVIDAEVADILAESNCRIVGMGIESASFHIRSKILNRDMSNDEIIQACNLLKKKKIKICLGNIMGIPGTQLSDDINTLRFNIIINPDLPVASILYPFPGMDILKLVKKNGIGLTDFNQYSSMRYPKMIL
ncbi:B12-binding domain-containing radical SAM protein, partial [Candidatus Desantisbacteria bacterium]|nr:B12-binding domain-containing radical SAM protein [Candidatus Desantisbacteria bacterium]